MKKNIFFLTVAIGFIFCLSSCSDSIDSTDSASTVIELEDQLISTRSSTTLCEDADTGCTSPWSTVTYVIPEGTPDYPDCEFSVTFLRRDCNGQIDLIYQSIGANIANDPDCLQFDLDTDNPLILDQVLQDVQADLIRAGKIRAVLDPNFTNGNNIPICGLGAPTTVNMFIASCSKFCVVLDFKPGAGFGYRVLSLPCGTACCSSMSVICIDLQTGELSETDISSPTPASPCNSETLLIPCPKGSVYTSACYPTCSGYISNPN